MSATPSAMPIKVLDIDLYEARSDIPVEGPYAHARALIRWRGDPLGQLDFPVIDHHVSLSSVLVGARERYGHLLKGYVAGAILFDEADAIVPDAGGIADCSVIVCTRDRPDDLVVCLDSLMLARPRPREIIVVDNAPPNDSTARVAARYPVRYLVENRRGVNWARSSGARAATSEILLYADDDVAVDAAWVGALCQPFADPAVGAVTGLVLARQLETLSQQAFEHHGGFVRGFSPRRFTMANTLPARSGIVGAGASMALRKALVTQLQMFDVEIDGGTAAMSGGDNYAFYLVLKNGHAIFYAPQAICWHRHRRTEGELKAQLYGYSVGVFAVLFRCIQDHRDWSACRVAAGWIVHHHLRNTIRGVLRRPGYVPLRYTGAEIRGVCAALALYIRTRRIERQYALRRHAGKGAA